MPKLKAAVAAASKAKSGSNPAVAPSGLRHLICTPTTALHGFRRGARRAVVPIHPTPRATPT
ncbi:MAG: hypothetical protein QF393_03505, partial [Rhodospirillales bacterium]|nr:hypothetical protein [Rhodospirillales bacterium]